MLEVFSYEFKNWKRAHIELLVGEKITTKKLQKMIYSALILM